MCYPRNLLLASSLNQRPAASLREQLVECSVFRVHFGPLYRVDDDGGRTRGAICPSTGSPYLVYERAPTMVVISICGPHVRSRKTRLRTGHRPVPKNILRVQNVYVRGKG
jgi:hypothetical protein